MPTSLTVTLPQPCQQSWAAMTPTAAGRHCAACQHEVVDFTTFTDGELAAYLARPGQLPCGRFRESQLGRVLLPAAAPVAGWRRWLGAVVALLGLGALATPARAQAGPGAKSRPAATAQTPGTQQWVGKPARPAATKAACTTPAPATAEPMLLGEPALAGAPVAVPVTMGRPALPPKKKK